MVKGFFRGFLDSSWIVYVMGEREFILGLICNVEIFFLGIFSELGIGVVKLCVYINSK